MDLKTFVTETLTQIADGIKTAQDKQDEFGATFSPKHFTYSHKQYEKTKDISANYVDELESIEFDVALTTTNNVSGAAKAGLEIAGLTLVGAKGDISHGNETVSRVKFKVFVRWPRCD